MARRYRVLWATIAAQDLDEIIDYIKRYNFGLMISLDGPQEVHDRSDSVGEDILGEQPGARYRDLMGARVNTLRTRILLRQSDLVVAFFGAKYRQWNTAADAGAAVAAAMVLPEPEPAAGPGQEVGYPAGPSSGELARSVRSGGGTRGRRF